MGVRDAETEAKLRQSEKRKRFYTFRYITVHLTQKYNRMPQYAPHIPQNTDNMPLIYPKTLTTCPSYTPIH